MLPTRTRIVSSLVLFSVLAAPTLAHAQGAQFDNPLGANNADPGLLIIDIISNTIAFLLTLSGVVALVVLVYAGLRLILGAAGSEAEVARAKTMILWAIIGFVVIGMSVAILRVVGNILF